MIFFHSSRVQATKQVDSMVKKHINIFLVQSWTKIFACTGLRIGTVLCPTQEKRDYLLSLQVPWSVTAFARAYLRAAIQDRSYLERTWEETPAWRSHMVTRLKRLHPSWQFHGKPWLSWIWIDTGSAEVAKDVYHAALDCGCPIRHAASGYDKASIVRLAVRRPMTSQFPIGGLKHIFVGWFIWFKMVKIDGL